MNSKLREEGVDFLFRSILQLKTVDECYDFFHGSEIGGWG